MPDRETYSKWETGHLVPSGIADSLIRTCYALESGDSVLLNRFAGKVEQTVLRRNAERKEATISAAIENNAWKARKTA